MAVTPKLNLLLPTGTDNADVENELLDTQLTQIDESFDATVCTSITHPTTNLYNGRFIFETDTLHLLYYKSGTWVLFSEGNKPLGRLAFVSSTAAGPVVSSGQELGPYLTLAFNQQKGRTYEYHWSIGVDHNTGHNTPQTYVIVRSTNDGTAPINTSNLLEKRTSEVIDNSSGYSIRQNGGTTIKGTTAATITLGLFLARSGANTDKVNIVGSTYNVFAVEDTGATP